MATAQEQARRVRRLREKRDVISMEVGRFNESVQAFLIRTRGDTKTFVRKIALDLIAAICMRTPVDTGRARGGWLPLLEGEGGQPPPITGSNVSAAAIDLGRSEGSYSIEETQDRITITIINAVRYVIYLEFGHSAQAPEGMVRVTLQEYAADLARRG